MALSGSFSKKYNTNSYGGYTYKINWTATQNAAKNTSTITCTHYLICDSGWSLYISGRTNTCVINGTSKSFSSSSISTSSGGTYKLGETSHTVSHGSDGKATFSITSTFNMQATLSGVYVSTIVATGSATLDTIPGASTITSASNISMGSKCSIKWTPKSASYKYRLVLTLGSKSVTLPSTSSYLTPNSTSAYTYAAYTFNSSDWSSQIGSSATSGKVTATLTTYNSGGTQIGKSSSVTFTLTIPSSTSSSSSSTDSGSPTIGTISLTPITYQDLVQGKNKFTVSVSGCSAGSGATIKSYTISGTGISSSTTTSTSTSCSFANLGPLSSSGTKTYTVTITNSRGYSTSKSVSATCYAYSAPSFGSFQSSRNGESMTCNYSFVYSSVNGKNSVKSATIHYKKSTAATYSSKKTLTATEISNGTCTITGLDTNVSYNVYAEFTDQYGSTANSSERTGFGGSQIVNVTKNGSGVAIGTKAINNYFTCAKTASFGGNVIIDGNTATASHIYTKSGSGGYIQADAYLKSTAGTLILKDRYFYSASTGQTANVLRSETVLYNNLSGTNGSITLSQSADNFEYLEIFYTDNNKRQQQSVRVFNTKNITNGIDVTLSTVEPSDTNSELRLYIATSTWNISGTNMIVATPRYKRYNTTENANRGVFVKFLNGSSYTITREFLIYVTRVVGYK